MREERLAEYAKKKAGKSKPAAKSIVTMDVKPWGDVITLKAHSGYTERCLLTLGY